MSKPKILVFDNEQQAAILKEQLKEYKLLHITSLEQAVVLCQKEKPNLIVVAAEWPSGYEGLHFIWRLRCEVKQNIPVILTHKPTAINLFANFSDGYYQLKEFLPVNLIMPKPLNLRTFKEVVTDMLQGAG